MKHIKILKLIAIISVFILFSCKQKNRIEKEKIDGFIVEKIFKNDTLTESKSFNQKNILEYHFIYNKRGKIEKVTEYYENGKIKTVSTLDKEPYYYLDIGYFPNGKVEHEGSISYIKKKKYRIGWFIFYNKNEKVHSIVEFDNDGNGNEWVVEKKMVEGNK